MEILEENKREGMSDQVKLKTLKSEIKVMIETLEDPGGQLALFQYYRDNKHKGADFLQTLQDEISNGDFLFV